eukprot:16165588-Heterocapsa_arctica.AAC.1
MPFFAGSSSGTSTCTPNESMLPHALSMPIATFFGSSSFPVLESYQGGAEVTTMAISPGYAFSSSSALNSRNRPAYSS